MLTTAKARNFSRDQDHYMKLTKAQAEQVAATVKRNNPIFTKILVHYEVAKNRIDWSLLGSLRGCLKSSQT